MTNGTVLGYQLTGISASDVVGGNLTGNITIGVSGQASINVSLTADQQSEGSETLVLSLLNGSTVVSNAAPVGIVDTSIAILPPTMGSESSDSFIGTPNADNFDAAAGNDRLQGFGGNDILNGGTGIDTAIWTGNSNNFKLTFAIGEWIIQDKTGAEGTDTVVNVEKLQFANKTVQIESKAHGSYDDLPESLWHFFIVAFNAAPGVQYMDQLAEAYRFGLSTKQIVDIFTTKSQFTSVYPTTLSQHDMATALVNNIVKNSAPEVVKLEAVNDIKAALGIGWSVGDVIYTVFGNLANKPLNDTTWGSTALQFQNQIAVAKYYTETMDQSTTDLATLRSVLEPVTPMSDVSNEVSLVALVGVGLLDAGG